MNVSDGAGLATLFKTLCSLIEHEAPDEIAILQAGKAKFGNSSSVRIKVEAVIQLAADHCKVACQLVAPQTLRTKEKKFSSIAGKTPEVVFNAGAPFTPKVMNDAVLTGWTQLPK